MGFMNLFALDQIISGLILLHQELSNSLNCLFLINFTEENLYFQIGVYIFVQTFWGSGGRIFQKFIESTSIETGIRFCF